MSLRVATTRTEKLNSKSNELTITQTNIFVHYSLHSLLNFIEMHVHGTSFPDRLSRILPGDFSPSERRQWQECHQNLRHSQ